MAVSGSQDYSQTREEIIKDALIELMVIFPGGAVSADDLSFANRKLNDMLKSWNIYKPHLWTYEEGVVVLDKDTIKDTVDTATDAHVCKADNFIRAKFGAAEAAAQTTITVDSSTGMAASDIIFLELDDGTLDQTTISSVTDATTIVISDALSSAASSANKISVYTPTVDHVVGAKDITSARLVNADGIEIPLFEISRDDYYNLYDKVVEGVPTSYYVNKKRDSMELLVWPECDSREYYMRFTYTKSIDDMDAASDSPDLPQEWLKAVKLNLACELAPAYGKYEQLLVLKQLATEALDMALSFDVEDTSVRIVPGSEWD